MLNLAPEPKKLRWTVRMEPTNSQGECQFSPRRKLTWPRIMSIFAQAKIDMPLDVNVIPMTSYAGLKKKSI